MEDAIVCGGGPAGLAVATWLGRYRRSTLLLDAGRQRNLPARAAHGYLTQDGAPPEQLLAAAMTDLKRYESVRIERTDVDGVRRDGDVFVVSTRHGEHRARRVVLATGVEDVFPDIDGFADLYGTAVFHCPCCDGYEARGRRVVAIGWAEHTAGYALDLLDWGAEVTLVTNGETFEGDEACRAALDRNDVELVEDDVAELCRDGHEMTGVALASGRTIEAAMAFFSIEHRPRTELARALGCDLDDDGYVVVDTHGLTTVPGVYAAGDVTPGEQLIQVAAAEGAVAGIACALSLRGHDPVPGAVEPGPDPERELDAAADDVSLGSTLHDGAG